MIETKISVGFFKYKLFSINETLLKEELAYYAKYKGGSFKIKGNTRTFLIEPVDLHYIYFNLFLRWIPKICNNENVFGAFMYKENYGLVINLLLENKLHIYEYCFRGLGKTSRDTDDIAQEIVVNKVEFINELFMNIIEFKKFYEEVIGINLSSWQDALSEASKAVNKINERFVDETCPLGQ